jgi:outer membrane immunogenic protein
VKKFILGTCVLVFMLATTSFAQSNSSSNDWRGFYIGANLGGAFGGSHARTSTIDDPAGYFATASVGEVNAAGDRHLDMNGFTGGGQIGYNATFAKTLLFGLEADFGALSLDDTTSSTGTYSCCPGTGFTVGQQVSTNWLFTARPRVGVTFGKALVYGTAGVAITKVKFGQLFTDTFDSALEFGNDSVNKAGWTAGGGVEFKLASHWSAKGEYLYAGFGDESHSSTNLTTATEGSFPSSVFTQKVDLHANIIRAGINYRF